MVSNGTEFAVGDIEKLFEEARRNTKAKHEKWAKCYNKRGRDVRIKVKVQRELVRSRGRRDQHHRPYYKEQGGKQQSTSLSRQETKRERLSCQNSKSRGAPQQ
ncbi:hypothetical protein TNCV_1518631 [Trichonephila clavipes]|nr:hypothetical protein TNCV_1518631 [Trichonephila clavipes]